MFQGWIVSSIGWCWIFNVRNDRKATHLSLPDLPALPLQPPRNCCGPPHCPFISADNLEWVSVCTFALQDSCLSPALPLVASSTSLLIPEAFGLLQRKGWNFLPSQHFLVLIWQQMIKEKLDQQNKLTFRLHNVWGRWVGRRNRGRVRIIF